MFIHQFLICGFIFKTTLSLRIDEGCEVKSKWEDALNWPEIRIGAWLSPNRNDNILEIRTKIVGKDDDLYHDRILLFRNHYNYIKTRHLNPTSESGNVTIEMNEGWMEFIFTVDDTFKLWYVGSNTTSSLLELPIEMEPRVLVIKGSNITLNCPSKLRTWGIIREPTIIPLDNSKLHQLSFYSKYCVSPSIALEQFQIPIRWDGQSLTTFSSMDSLPAHQLHNITIECKIEKIKYICKVSESGKTLTDVSLTKLPEYIKIKGEGDASFYVLLHRNDPYLALSSNTTNRAFTSQSAEAGNATVMVLGIFLAIAIITILVLVALSYRSRQLQRKKEDSIEMGVNMPLLKGHADAENTVLATKENMVQEVQKLLNRMSKGCEKEIEKACVEAHLLSRKEIIKIFDSSNKFEREDIIQLVQKEYSWRVEEVFAAAHKGYCHKVTVLLLEYELPHSIRDSKGCSILHIIASAKESERPLWESEVVHDFLQNKSCYPNAVNYDGQTCLHYLANAASNMNTTTIWGKRSIPVKTAWLELANILFNYGCDPRIKDAEGQLPHETAKGKRNLELSDILRKHCYVLDGKNKKKMKSHTGKQLPHKAEENTELSQILSTNYVDEDCKNNEKKGSEAKDQQSNEITKVKTAFGTFVNEAGNGDTASVLALMKYHQQLLPLDATNDPLTESLSRGHLETSMLLLSGGASICGRSLSSFTPIEAAHGLKSLPAIFPAIMRMECINRLTHEANKIGQDAKYGELLQHIKTLISKVKKGAISSLSIGDESKSDDENSKHARKLLCMAAQRGLPLTCQMFGLLNVNLQPYPSEEKPILNAHMNGHEGIVYILTRDLKMSVFSHIEKSKLQEAFLQELWEDELKQLRRVCFRRRKNSEYTKWMDQINKGHTGTKIDKVDEQMLTYIAQNGLIYIFHVIKENMKNFDINRKIDEITGCTILHIAAMYGRLSMVEYLLYDTTTNVLAQSKGGFTPAHLAAVRGYKDCMNYLLFYMKADHSKIDVKCDGGNTPLQLLHGYKMQANNFKNFFISDEVGVEVWHTPNAKDKLRFFLEKKFSLHQVYNQATLRQFTKKLVSDPSASKSISDDSGFIKNEIREEITYLFEEISKSDERLKGRIVAYRTNGEYLQIPIDSVEVIWEVQSNQHQRREDQNSFKEHFYESVKLSLKSFSFKSPAVWLSYPTIKKNYVGVTLFLAFHETSERTGLIKVFLTPVLKTDILVENKTFNHPVIKECANMSSLAYLANTNENNWVFIAVKMEDEIIKRLTEEQRIVLHACVLLYKLLYSCWWFPRAENRRHSRTWRIYALRMITLPPRVLTSLFLEEIDNTRDEEWTEENFLERMISIFKRAVKVDKSGKITPKKNIQMHLDCRQSTYDASNLVCCIVEVLETLRNKDKQTEIQ